MSTSHHNELLLLLVNNNIFPEGSMYPDGLLAPQPTNLTRILRHMSLPLPELSGIAEADFQRFRDMNNTISRGTLMRRVIPILEGSAGAAIMNDGEIELDNLSPLVEGVETVLQPDYFDGLPFVAVDRHVRDALGGTIIPCKHISAPVVPNFFLEVRRQSGNAAATKTEACYYGACGARAMHALQNYSTGGKPEYDGNAYSFSSTYVNGLLKIYAHLITAPGNEPGALPAYHMVELKAFNMTSTYQDFIDGCTAFRNLRAMAVMYRTGWLAIAKSMMAV